MHRLGILLSGRGSNFLAIAAAIEDGGIPSAQIALVLSNVEGAPGLDTARRRSIPTIVQASKGVPREEHDGRMIDRLRTRLS